MKQVTKHDLYESPEVEVMEMKAVQVMCTSNVNGDPTTMDWGDDNGSNWN